MPESPVICLVSPGHFSSNPRLVKEALALLENDHEVRAVTSDQVPWFSELDQQMPEVGPVDSVKLPRLRRPLRLLLRLRQMGFRLLVAACFRLGVRPSAWQLAEALNLDCRRLRNAINRQNAGAGGPCDLAIAHNLAALPAVAASASRWGHGYAFDAEDSHVDELDLSATFERRLRRSVEAAFLPGARYVSAASPGIGGALQQRYGVKPSVILNVFDAPVSSDPLGRRPSGPDSAPDALRFFWFSQTAGPDRGLDQFMGLAPAVMAELKRPLALTVVGRPVSGFDEQLRSQARAAGVRLTLKPLMAPGSLIPLAASHDCGLALEHPVPVNKDICLANKIFTYLAAGIPMLLSPTSAHVSLFPDLQDSAFLLRPSPQPKAVAQWLQETVMTGIGSAAARRVHADRFSWRRESSTFMQHVKGAL